MARRYRRQGTQHRASVTILQSGLPGDMLGVLLLRFPARFGDAVARFGRRMDLADLTQYGLPVPDEGVFTKLRRLEQAPAVVDREVVESIKSGRIQVLRGVESLDESAVQIARRAHHGVGIHMRAVRQ